MIMTRIKTENIKEKNQRERLQMTASHDADDNYQAVVVALEADRPYSWHLSFILSVQCVSAQIISL